MDRLRVHALTGSPAPQFGDSYTSSGHPYLRVPVPKRRLVARTWVREHTSLATAEVLAVVDRLFAGDSHEEKTLGAFVLAYAPAARAAVTADDVDRWLDQLRGWAEIDALCSNVFTSAELLGAWAAWEPALVRLAKDESVDKRRAALVLLTGPVHDSDDERLRDRAFLTIDELTSEREIAITKAISWLLRSLITRHRDDVVAYLDASEESLPRIAVRETRTKLRTGTKSGRRD